MDGGGSELAVVPAECAGPGRKHRRYIGASCGVSFARADLRAPAARSDGRENREPEVFSRDAIKVWDALTAKGKAFDIHPAGMIALDIARIEAGLILIEVDYISSKKALIESQKYSPAEIGLGKLVDLKKETFVGREALALEAKKGAERALVGLEINWNEVEALYDKLKMAPQVPSMASRVAVPVYRNGRQVGKATSTTWSPTLKKMIALACVGRESSAVGSKLSIEMTVEAVRQTVSAKVVPLPFFNPARKMAVPVI